jgi:DNA polymerase-3 subunit alpha
VTNPNDFVHLHVHSNYSILDGISSIEALVNEAIDNKYSAIALTDHGNMHGSFEFYKAAKSAGIKPIVGVEAYCARNTINESKTADNPTDHMVILARNETGYKNLLKLVTRASIEGFNYVPRVDLDMIREHREGLIGTSACLSGGINSYAIGEKFYNRSTKTYEYRDPNYAKAIAYADKLKNTFEEGYFYLEIQDHSTEADMGLNSCRMESQKWMVDKQKIVVETAKKIAKELDIPMVVSNDVHYTKKSDWNAKDTLFAVRTISKKYDPERKLTTDSDQFYLKSKAEMIDRFRDFPEAINNTLLIAEQCDLDITVGENHIPVFDTKGQDVNTYWRNKIRKGFETRYKQGTEYRVEAIQRVKYEIDVIESMGFVSYFLMVADFISYARQANIPVGPGRGSAAGSIVSYCLNITEICPLKHKLIFERFLNSERISLPDIDIDFCKKRVGEVYGYAQQKYGEKNVARIATFTSMWAKSLIRDIGKAYDIPKEEINTVAASIPEGAGEFRARMEDQIDENDIIKAYASSSEIWKTVLNDAVALEGAKKAVSKHAAGFVIGDDDLTKYIPLMRPIKNKPGKKKNQVEQEVSIDTTDTMMFTQYPMNDLEELGLIKMDFLALETLTIINDCIALIQKHENTDVTQDLTYTNLLSPNTYTLMSSGNTLGVFQCESPGLRHLLMQIRPEQFNDIVAAIALYRPGPMDAIDEETGMTMMDKYVQNRSFKKNNSSFNWELLHPEMNEILKETYGIIIYQEQIMDICRKVCGYTYNEADKFRKAVGKKIPELVAKERKNFMKGALGQGDMTQANADKLFAQLETFARYGFNKSHAAAYAVLTYRTAWLKEKFPIYYMSALLNAASNKSDGIDKRKYVNDCLLNNIKVYAPDINKSQLTVIPEDNGIRCNLSMIRGVDNISVKIIAERERNGEYNSFIDCMARLSKVGANKTSLEALISSGSMDCIGNRDQMTHYGWDLLRAIRKKQKRDEGFASILDDDELDIPDMSNAPVMDKKMKDSLSVKYLELYSLKNK